ncbi:MAG: alcohol dehydrogenase catalytic domain-containing protein [Nitrososphaerota archaeon]
MKAAFVLSPREVVIEEASIPVLAEREVLVRVEACGICASDLKFFNGLKSYRETPFGRSSPGFTGHEWAGVVVSIGPGVTAIREGDRVVPYIITSCGLCKYCREGRENLCAEKRYIHGGFAEYIKVPEQNLIRILENIRVEDACLTEPTACCLHAIEQLDLKPDDTVAIIGDGPMGLLHLQLIRNLGSRVIVIGHHEERLKMADTLGADLVINSLEIDPYKAVMEATDGYGADAVILAINNKDAMSSALRLVSKGGRISIFAGSHPDYKTNISPNRIHYSELTITGSADALRKNYHEALSLMESRAFKPSSIITHIFTLEKIEEALEVMQKRKAIKAIVKP